MDSRTALERAVSKMMNNRHRPDSYADILNEGSSIENWAEGLKRRFNWSRYQKEEVLRLAQELIESS